MRPSRIVFGFLLLATACSERDVPEISAEQSGSTTSSSSTSTTVAPATTVPDTTLPEALEADPPLEVCGGQPKEDVGRFVIVMIVEDGSRAHALCDPATGDRTESIRPESGGAQGAVVEEAADRATVLFGSLVGTGPGWRGKSYLVDADGFTPGATYEFLPGKSSFFCRDGQVIALSFEHPSATSEPLLRWTETAEGVEVGGGGLDLRTDYVEAAALVQADCDGIDLGFGRYSAAAGVLNRLMQELGMTDVGFDHSANRTASAAGVFNEIWYTVSLDLNYPGSYELAGPWAADCDLGFLTINPTPSPDLLATLMAQSGCSAR